MAVNYNLILSNQYNSLCELYPVQKNNYNIITLQTGQIIIDTIINEIKNDKAYHIREINLIGGDNKTLWDTITMPLINYIREQDIFIKIVLESSDIDFISNSIILKYLKDNSINLIINIISTNYNQNLLSKIINTKPLTTIRFFINNDSTLKNLYQHYQNFNQLKIKNLKFIFNFYNLQNINEITNYFQDYINNISSFIYNSFLENSLILIPEDIALAFLQVLILDMKLETKLNTYDLFYSHCMTINKDMIFINQKGELFACSFEPLDSLNDVFLGNIDLQGKKINFNNINLLKTIYNKINIIDLFQDDIKKQCKNCILSQVCSTGCYSKNIKENSIGDLSNKFYCIYHLFLYNKIKDITLMLDKEQNELFKNYLYGCTIKSIKGI